MSHQRRSSLSANSSSSSSSSSFLSRAWIYCWWNAKAILSLPFFVKVRVRHIINYCCCCSSSSLADSYPSSSSSSTCENWCKNARRRRKTTKNSSCFLDKENQIEKWKIGKMAQFVSRALALLGFAFTVHFILISALADKDSLEDFSSWSSLSSSSRDTVFRRRESFDFGRQARSYHHADRGLSVEPIAMANTVSGMGAGLAGAGVSARSSDRPEALFATENSTVVTAQIGSTAVLPCVVRNLGNGVASWIRRHDYHLLTVGMGTYSNDDRFVVSHNRPNQNWELHIKFVKPSDEGMYECQISTHPPSSIFIRLRVVEAKAEILGEPDKHVRAGSTFELVCVLRDSTEPPVYVFWYHNDRMINYDNERGVVVSSDVEKSILTIQEAQKSDSGNYTCQPSNASPSWIVVHILNGEKPAAMQHGSRNAAVKIHNSPHSPQSLFFVISILSILLTRWLTHQALQHQVSGNPKMEMAICDAAADDEEKKEEEEEKDEGNENQDPEKQYHHHYHPRQVIIPVAKCSRNAREQQQQQNKRKVQHQLRQRLQVTKCEFEQAEKLSSSDNFVRKACSVDGSESFEGRHGRSSLDSPSSSCVVAYDMQGPTATNSFVSTKVTSPSSFLLPQYDDPHVDLASFSLFPSSVCCVSSSLSPSPSFSCYRTEHDDDCGRRKRRRSSLRSAQRSSFSCHKLSPSPSSVLLVDDRRRR